MWRICDEYTGNNLLSNLHRLSFGPVALLSECTIWVRGREGACADLGEAAVYSGEGADDRADRADAGAWRLWRGPDGHGWPAGRLCGHDSAARRPAAAASVSPSSRRPAGRCSVDHHGDTRRSAGVMGCSIGASSRAVSGSARPWMCACALHHAACAAHHTSRTSQNLVDLTWQPEGSPRRLADGSCHSHSHSHVSATTLNYRLRSHSRHP